jgi:hypothetical protein
MLANKVVPIHVSHSQSSYSIISNLGIDMDTSSSNRVEEGEEEREREKETERERERRQQEKSNEKDDIFPLKQISRQFKILGADEEEIKRYRALKKLGVTNDDYKLADKLFLESNGSKSLPPLSKTEKMTGYLTSQVKRNKAIKILGTSEEGIVEERSRRLSSLGITHTPIKLFPKLKSKPFRYR